MAAGRRHDADRPLVISLEVNPYPCGLVRLRKLPCRIDAAPDQPVKIELCGKRRLDDVKVRRDIEVTRHTQAVMACMVHMPETIRAIRPPHRNGFDQRQDRILHGGKALRDQCGADGARGIAAPQRQHATAPVDRHRGHRHEISRQIKHVFQIILMPESAARIGNELSFFID